MKKTYLGVTGEREVLSLRVTLEAVVSKKATEIRMVSKEDTIHIPNLAFVPIGSLVKVTQGTDGGELISVCSDASPGVVTK